MIGEKQIKREKARVKEFNKIDGLVGAQNVGHIVDSMNEDLERKREKEYENEMNARNKYFLPLWRRAIEELRSGFRVDPKKEKRPEVYQVPKIYVPRKKDPIVVK